MDHHPRPSTLDVLLLPSPTYTEGGRSNTLSDYERYLTRCGLAPKTVTTKMQMIGNLHKYLGRCPTTATTDEIETWLDSRNLSATTRYKYVSHLHTFYKWAVAWGHATEDPTARVVRPKLPRYLPRPIPEADLALAISFADPQMACWLILAAYAGMRCAEIAALEVDDLDFAGRNIRVRGKGSKDRIVPMHELVVDYCRVHGLPRRGPVFTRPDGQPWPAQKVSYRGARYLRRRGIDSTMHQLRHRFATQTYAACRDLRVTQELLGHASPTTTAVYAAWSPTIGRAAVEALT